MSSTERSERPSTRMKNWIYRNRQILTLSGLFFVATFVLGLFYPQLGDQATHRIFSQYLLEYGKIPFLDYELNYPIPFMYPPLFHILGAVFKYVFGIFTILPALMGAISVFLTYRLVEMWYGHKTAFQTAVFFAFIPQFFLYGARYRIETTLTAGFLAVFYLYFLYRESGNRKYIYSAYIIGGVMAALKTYGPLAAIIITAHLLWEKRGQIFSAIKDVFWPIVVGVLFSLPWPVRNYVLSGHFTKVSGSALKKASADPSTGLKAFMPSLNEIKLHWGVQMLGLEPTDIVYDLSRIHEFLPSIWFILPAGLLIFVLYGVPEEKDNSFIWIWGLLVLAIYELGRIMSGGEVLFKSRHLITFFPAIALFAARAYQKINWRKNIKRTLFLLLGVALIVQMLAVATIRTQFANTYWNPAIDWVEENVEEDEVIFGGGRNLAAQTEGYKIIQQGYKKGYIRPNESIQKEITKADWVVWPNRTTKTHQEMRIEFQNLTNLELVNRIDAYRDMPYGRIGRTWWIYKVKKD